jgi:tripartite ATP-independent transporter DctM subunit
MDRFGYNRRLSTGIVAVAGTLGNFIPPSVILIIFGISTQLSISKLFIAGIIPGLILALFFALVGYGWCKIDPSVGPRADKFPWKERMATLPVNIWPLSIFIIIIGGLTMGVFSPTEAGSIGAFAVLILCLAKRDMGFHGFIKSVQEAVSTAGMFLLLVASSAVLGHFLAVTNISGTLGEWVSSLPLHRAVIMAIIMVIYVLGGSFIDDLAFMLLATPIFFPIIVKLGYDPYWAGIMIAGFCISIGSVIPPVAICVFVVKNITHEPMNVIYSGCYPFLISLVLCVILLFMFPELATFLPSILVK